MYDLHINDIKIKLHDYQYFNFKNTKNIALHTRNMNTEDLANCLDTQV